MTAVDIIWAVTRGICSIIIVSTLMNCLYKIIKKEINRG